MPKPAIADQSVPNCSLPSTFASRRRRREEAGQTDIPPRQGPSTVTMEGQSMVMRSASLRVGDETMRSASLRVGDETISPFDDERKA